MMPQELPAKKGWENKKNLPSFTQQNPYLPLKRILFFLQRNLPSCPKLHELELTWSGTFCPTDSPKIPWKTQPWNRLGVTALPTFHGLNLPKHPEKQSKKLQNLSQLHPSAHSCYPAAGRRRSIKKTRTDSTFRLASTSAETAWQNQSCKGRATGPSLCFHPKMPPPQRVGEGACHSTCLPSYNYHLLQHESFQLQYLPKQCICN